MSIKRWLKLLHYKWVKGRCRHICALCEFAEKCYIDLEV